MDCILHGICGEEPFDMQGHAKGCLQRQCQAFWTETWEKSNSFSSCGQMTKVRSGTEQEQRNKKRKDKMSPSQSQRWVLCLFLLQNYVMCLKKERKKKDYSWIKKHEYYWVPFMHMALCRSWKQGKTTPYEVIRSSCQIRDEKSLKTAVAASLVRYRGFPVPLLRTE